MACRYPVLLVLTLALPATAQAQGLPPGIPAPTHDWGCEVLLCLANPAGPTAAPACVPPIQRLWRDLRRGRPFPSCRMAAGPNGRSYAQPGWSSYDPCPDGSSELPAGQFAELAAPMPATVLLTRSGAASTYAAASPGLLYAGIGNGADGLPYRSEAPPPVKVCVAGLRDTRSAWIGDAVAAVGRYDAVYVSPMQASARVIDVYVDDTFWHRVRW